MQAMRITMRPRHCRWGETSLLLLALTLLLGTTPTGATSRRSGINATNAVLNVQVSQGLKGPQP
jgi:hypothetical protein